MIKRCTPWFYGKQRMTRKEIRYTWRRNHRSLLPGATHPTWEDDKKAYPRVGLMLESLWSTLYAYLIEDKRLCPKCSCMESDDMRAGSVKFRHIRLQARLRFMVESKPTETPIMCSLSEAFNQSSDSNDILAWSLAPILGISTPALSSAMWSNSRATDVSQVSL
jgi:hypothetical protein